jgi:cupin 2 domain-containing protein
MPKSGNCFADLPERLAEEAFTTLASFAGARIERIVSTGQASPPGFWYDQDGPEWVILLAGSAGLLFEGEDEPLILAPGDYVEIPPRVRHRVEWTDASRPTVWLAVHGAIPGALGK